MTYWDIGMRHIVDVDGQLLAIDAEVIDTATLLERAGRPAGSVLWLVRAGERTSIEPRQLLRLSQDEVLFFATGASASGSDWSRLAA